MKQIYKLLSLIVLVGFIQTSIFAQEKVSNKMYNDLRDMDEVTYLSFSKNLMDFIDFEIESDDDAQHQVTGDLNEVKLVIFKPDFTPEKPFKEIILRYLRKGNYDKVEDEDGDDDTEVWVNRRGRKIYECHVIFQGEQNGVLLSFFGDFNIKDVNKLKAKIKDYKD